MASDDLGTGQARWVAGVDPPSLTLLLPTGREELLHSATSRLARGAFGAPQLVPPELATSEPTGLRAVFPLPSVARPLAVLRGRSSESLLAVAAGAADAVATLHDRGLCHGSLAPEVVFEHGGSALVAGLGARELTRLAELRLPRSEWDAPELSSEREASTLSDVFALGRMTEWLLPDPSAPIREVVARATAPQPSRRQPDAHAFARELRRAATESAPRASAAPVAPIAAPPPPSDEAAPAPLLPLVPPASAPRPSPKRESALPTLLVIAGALLLLIGVVGVIALAKLRGEPAATVTQVASAGDDAGTSDPGSAPPPVEPPASPAEPPAPAPEPEPPASADPPTPAAPSAAGEPRPFVHGGDPPLPLTAAQPAFGRPDAVAHLLVFGDLHCQHTRRFLASIDKLLLAFPDDLQIVWRHRPLTAHAGARTSAELAQGLFRARGSGAFAGLLRSIGRHPGPLGAEEFLRVLAAQQVSESERRRLGDEPRAKAEVAEDLRLAGQMGVRATPTFYLNGSRIEGFLDHRSLESLIRAEVRASRALLGTGVRPSELYAARTRKNLIGIGSDVSARTCPPIGRAPVRGSNSALVTLVVYSEFQCSYCKQLHTTLEDIIAKRGGDVRIAFKHFPLPNHPHARKASELTIEARRQKGDPGFWAVHDLLFEAQAELGTSDVWERLASRAGLDTARALGALGRGDHSRVVQDDVREGDELAVKGTPTTFINGRRLEGARTAAELARVVDEEVDWARRMIQAGAPRSEIYRAVCGER